MHAKLLRLETCPSIGSIYITLMIDTTERNSTDTYKHLVKSIKITKDILKITVRLKHNNGMQVLKRPFIKL